MDRSMAWHSDAHQALPSNVARVETGDTDDNFSQVGYLPTSTVDLWHWFIIII